MERRSIEIALVLSTLVGLGVACGTNAGGPGGGSAPPPLGGHAGEGVGEAGAGATATGGEAPIGRPRPRVPKDDGGAGAEPPDGGGGDAGDDGIVAPAACMGDPTTPPPTGSCGDGFRSLEEECDDGNAGSDDACTSTCRVRDSLPLVNPPAPFEQVMSNGRHPLGSGCAGTALGYVERNSSSTSSSSVILARFDRQGALRGVTRDMSEGLTPAAVANPVVAELGGGAFAVAWTDIDGDGNGLGIALRRVTAESGAVGALSFANETTFAAQSDPDLLWVGDTLIAAWVDQSDLENAPDVRLRKFGMDLQPLGGEEPLAATSRHEADVALAAYRGSWAAAWRSSSEGLETIEVSAGQSSWTVGPFLPGGADDRPALVELDPQHLLVVFTAGTDPTESSVADVPRLRGAILGAPGPTPSFEIAPRATPYAEDASLGQDQPNVLRVEDRIYISWRSSGVVADPLGEEVWLKEIRFTADGDDVVLDLDATEIALPRSDGHRTGDQRSAALFPVPFALGAAIAAAWMDYGPFGSAASGPGPVFELIPMPILRLPANEASP